MKSFQSELQQRDCDITGQFELNQSPLSYSLSFPLLLPTPSLSYFPSLLLSLSFSLSLANSVPLLSGLRGELRGQEERGRAKEKEREELEETVDILRKELNKTELARKDASIRVRTHW